ncbi:MAG TPA: hypothetical protein VK919_02450, partial [Solirubrobacterales bacterium]|nr:hypothetical protein [Solirubrobacterales bacterium]
EVPRGERRRRPEVLRPQEAIAGLLAGREPVPVSVSLLLRARADLDSGRLREAALQLRAGLEALLKELDRDPIEAPPGEALERHRDDLRELRGRRPEVADAAAGALGGELGREHTDAVAETLAICERVLRRRRVQSRAIR